MRFETAFFLPPLKETLLERCAGLFGLRVERSIELIMLIKVNAKVNEAGRFKCQQEGQFKK
jgi:hypothetical protein